MVTDSVSVMTGDALYDCVIVGAGPGGLQAAIYLGRYNRHVLLIDRGGGRTWHARRIENFLTQKAISGKELIALGTEQVRSFNVEIRTGLVTRILKNTSFETYVGDEGHLSKFVIVSTGVSDHLPEIENLHRFLGRGFFTCVDCDGYMTTGRKLVVIGNSLQTVHLAFAMREMYTREISLILYSIPVPPEYREELQDENIRLVTGRPAKIIGGEEIEAIELRDGLRVECEVIMSNFGYRLNDSFLSGLDLKRDSHGFKYVVSSTYESSLRGLYILGPLNTGGDQAIVAAGQGAVAAIDIKKRLFNP